MSYTASEILLTASILNTLQKAKETGLKSISIETFTSKLFGYPREECAFIMIAFAAKWAATGDTGNLKTIRFVNKKEKHVMMFRQFMQAIYKVKTYEK
jgi:O-acetyl-ADP-ribose deacetylase